MRTLNRGISLMELLVVLFALTLVSSMAFQFLWESNTVVSRYLSQASKADRLRILEKSIARDLGSAYPNPLEAGVWIGVPTGTIEEKILLRTRIVETNANEEPVVAEVQYRLTEYPENSGRISVIRALDPHHGEGEGDAPTIRRLFSLDVQETLDWSVENTGWRGATSPSILRFRLTNSRFKDFPTQREILVHGVVAP